MRQIVSERWAIYDARALAAVYGGAHGPWGPAMIALTWLGSGWAALALLPLLGWPRTRSFAGALAARHRRAGHVGVGAQARRRPRATRGSRWDLRPRMGAPHDGSFPSGHASGSFCVAAFLAMALPAVWPGPGWRVAPWPRRRSLLAALVAVSRVYLGAHFPSDVLAGALMGAAFGAVAARASTSRVEAPQRERRSSADVRAFVSLGFAVACTARTRSPCLSGSRHRGVDRRLRDVLQRTSSSRRTSCDDGGDGDGGRRLDARDPPDCDAGVPAALACTGLYADWPTLALAPDVHAYRPGATMWADGATSLRWIWLPPGTKIDTSDPNSWVFPVGTKLWQELSILGKRIETRFSWKQAPTLWFRPPTRGRDNLYAAPSLTLGLPNARGLPYEIPAVSACEKCHNGANDFVLGFEEVGLAMPQASGLNLEALERDGLLTNPPAIPPAIPGDAATAGSSRISTRNCGTSCHNRNKARRAGQTGLFMKLTVDASGRAAVDRAGKPTPGSPRTRCRASSPRAARRRLRQLGHGGEREPAASAAHVLPARPGDLGAQHDRVAHGPPRRRHADAADRDARGRRRRRRGPRRLGHRPAPLTARPVGVERPPKRR